LSLPARRGGSGVQRIDIVPLRKQFLSPARQTESYRIQLPSADRMGDLNLQRTRPPGIIKVRGKNPVRLEELRFEYHVTVNLDWRRGNTELRECVDQVLLVGRRKFNFCGRAHPVLKEVEIVLHGNALDGFIDKLAAFLFRGLRVGKKPPKPAPYQQDNNDNNG
jgi:hypothetical protein